MHSNTVALTVKLYYEKKWTLIPCYCSGTQSYRRYTGGLDFHSLLINFQTYPCHAHYKNFNFWVHQSVPRPPLHGYGKCVCVEHLAREHTPVCSRTPSQRPISANLHNVHTPKHESEWVAPAVLNHLMFPLARNRKLKGKGQFSLDGLVSLTAPRQLAINDLSIIASFWTFSRCYCPRGAIVRNRTSVERHREQATNLCLLAQLVILRVISFSTHS